jgi:hypothetical protein
MINLGFRLSFAIRDSEHKGIEENVSLYRAGDGSALDGRSHAIFAKLAE